jgi:molecular chaperone DnaK
VGYGLGVDLGTTFTAAAVERDGRVEMVTLGDRSAAVPSVVLVREDGQVLTGDAADRRAATEPDRVAREVKRRLGDPMPLVLGGTPYAAAQLMGMQLRDVLTLVSEREGGMPDAVTLTHPANWGPYKKELFSQIPRTAGLREVRMLTEPEGAAAHYAANERLDEGALVAVYDLGGGTFDATVLRTAGKGFEILGTPEGLEGLGGIDFDEAVFNHVDRSLGGPLSALDPSDPHDTTAVIRLRQDCARAKEALSADTEATIPVMLPKLQTEVRLTRGEFEDMIRPSISATIEALNRALLSAGVAPDHLSTVLLVGGSSRIPLVSQMVSAELGRPTSVDAHPKHAIVLGAAAMSGRGYVDGRGKFTGPASGAAPVTTALGQGGPRTGPTPSGTNSGMIPVASRTGGPPTGGGYRPTTRTGAIPTGQTQAVRPGPPIRPAEAGSRVPPPALNAAGTPAAGIPAPALRGSGAHPTGETAATSGGARRRLPIIIAALALLLLAGGGTFVYQQVSNATPAPPAPPAAVIAPAPTTTSEAVPAQDPAATVAPTRAPRDTGGGGGSSSGGGGGGGWGGGGRHTTTTTWSRPSNGGCCDSGSGGGTGSSGSGTGGSGTTDGGGGGETGGTP